MLQNLKSEEGLGSKWAVVPMIAVVAAEAQALGVTIINIIIIIIIIINVAAAAAVVVVVVE